MSIPLAVMDNHFLTEYEGSQLLADFGLPIAKNALATTVEEAKKQAQQMVYPVVLKGMSKQITHKTEAGIVAINIQDEQTLTKKFQEIMQNAANYDPLAIMDGILVQEMVSSGIELIVGIKKDPIFGHNLVIGMGGTLVEVLNDFAMRLMPVSRQDILDMIAQLKSTKILDGYRGKPGINKEVLIALCKNLNDVVVAHPQIQELDFNPVIFGNEQAVICDVRILLENCPKKTHIQRSLEHVHRFLKPKSIAIVGASTNPRKNGGRLVKYLKENHYEGKVFPINPGATEIIGYRCYPSLLDIEEPIDVVCIIVAAHQVPEVIRQCQQKGVHNVIIYSSGFAEIGEEGKRLQQEIIDLAIEGDIRIIGPNVIGVASPNDQVYMAFGSALDTKDKVKGSIAFISQSGAIGSALISRAWENKVGFSRWVTLGNEADLTAADFIDVFAEDEQTKVISVFMEGVKDSITFEKATAKALKNRKPVLVFKTGGSEIGKLAVQSHTGSIAGDAAVYKEAFKKFNVIEVEYIEELYEMAATLENQPLPKGNRMGVLTASGGVCSIIADLCEKYGLEIPNLGETSEKIKRFIPDFGSAQNPVDVTAEVIAKPEMFKQVLELMVQDEQLDGILIMLTSNADPGALVIAQAIYEVYEKSEKPIIVGRLGANAIAPKAVDFYQKNNFFVYPNPEKIVRAMKYLVQYSDILIKNNINS